MSGSVSPTAAYVDATGIHAPTYQQIVAYLVNAHETIYGSDIVVEPATQDGQLIGIFSLALADTNNACIAVYNSFSPSTAQGVGLSSVVKINGMARKLPSNSQVDLRVVGIAGTEIYDGVAADGAGSQWNLPAYVLIPPAGEITVLALAATLGAIPALPNTIIRIATPTYGWQTVSNPDAASLGAPVENDAQLRIRQAQSTMLPSQTVLDGIVGGVASLPGVVKYRGYENDTGCTDAITTLPPHSICMVVLGGDPIAICQTILNKKTPGCYTYGDVRETVLDVYNIAHDIGFFIPDPIPISVAITIMALPGYSTTIGNGIITAIAAFINALPIGVDVVWSKLMMPANLCAMAPDMPANATATFIITSMTIGLDAFSLAMQDIPIAFDEMATCDPAAVIVTVA